MNLRMSRDKHGHAQGDQVAVSMLLVSVDEVHECNEEAASLRPESGLSIQPGCARSLEDSEHIRHIPFSQGELLRTDRKPNLAWTHTYRAWSGQ